MGEVPLYHRGVGVFLWARYPCIQAVDLVRTRAANRLPKPYTLTLHTQTLNPEPSTLNPQP